MKIIDGIDLEKPGCYHTSNSGFRKYYMSNQGAVQTAQAIVETFNASDWD
ncbi:uncharacterized protein METZ01_LOCUS322277, partial [marine metagenome]